MPMRSFWRINDIDNFPRRQAIYAVAAMLFQHYCTWHCSELNFDVRDSVTDFVISYILSSNSKWQFRYTERLNTISLLTLSGQMGYFNILLRTINSTRRSHWWECGDKLVVSICYAGRTCSILHLIQGEGKAKCNCCVKFRPWRIKGTRQDRSILSVLPTFSYHVVPCFFFSSNVLHKSL